MEILWILLPFLAFIGLIIFVGLSSQKGYHRGRRHDSGGDGGAAYGYGDSDRRHDSDGWWGDGGFGDGGGDGGGGGGGD